MRDSTICGTCHQLVFDPQGDACPKCSGPLVPSFEEKLRAFVANGVDVTRQGIPVKVAQEAADEVLGALLYTRVRLNRHHLGDTCTECEED